MAASNPITIVGGGLAGLTLGIGLRLESVPVVVWEAGEYPRHRVCGEFISGRGQDSLKRFGLFDALGTTGATSANTIAFFSVRRRLAVGRLPQTGVSFPRYELDRLLAEKLVRLGGDLRCESRWKGKEFGEGVVRATGRKIFPRNDGWRLFGVKAHAENVRLDADLEIHFGPAGYVGLSKLASGKVNVCGFFRQRANATAVPGLPVDRLRGEPRSLLCRRLQTATWEAESFCGVGSLPVTVRESLRSNECRVGDAIAMTPPFTGNGMSMAFESAELARDPLTSYSRGDSTWNRAITRIGNSYAHRFTCRLRWARLLQLLLFHGNSGTLLLPMAVNSIGLWRLLFWATR
ncbi:MAG: hypothetical protein DME26_03205 [Verrucomicrobia bacterium]|nr:MAG: hypothetical protein DME26_03205 [Verrucomicrobiota bacterium]